MKILTFTTLWPNHIQPFHGLFVRERIKALVKQTGCELQVVAPVPWSLSVKFFGEQYYKYSQIQKYEKYNSLNVFHPRFVLFPKVGKFLDGFLMSYSVRRFVKRMRKKFPYDLIDIHYAYPDGYAAGRIARDIGVPYTVTVRGSDINVFGKERLRGFLIRQSLMGANQVISVSEPLKAELLTLGIPAAKIVVIENGVDNRKFYPVPKPEARRQLQLAPNTHIVLSVGHLRELKGFHLLIEAIKKFQTQQNTSFPVKLIVIGGESPWDTSYKERLIRQINENNLHKLVSLIGPKSPEELTYWYSAADVFCLASSREGCPNVILESLACGTPVVATAVGGIPQMISNREIGILVERHPQSFYQGIAEALDRTWNHDKIIQHVQKQYSWEVTAAKIYSVFETLV